MYSSLEETPCIVMSPQLHPAIIKVRKLMGIIKEKFKVKY